MAVLVSNGLKFGSSSLSRKSKLYPFDGTMSISSSFNTSFSTGRTVSGWTQGLSKRALLAISFSGEGGEEGALKGGGGEDTTSRETSEGVDTLELDPGAGTIRGGRAGNGGFAARLHVNSPRSHHCTAL